MGDALLLSLLGPLLGGALGGLGAAAGGKSWNGTTENINTDYANNPIYQLLMKSGGMLDQAGAGMSAGMNAATAAANGYDPTAFWKDFMSAAPGLSSLLTGATGSVKSAMESNLADFTKQAVSQAGSNLAGMGSLYSGALGDIVGTNVGKQAAQSNVDLSTLLANMYSPLGGQMLGGFSSGRQAQANYGIQAGLGNAGLWHGLLNQGLGIGADLSSPVYQYQPGIMDAIMQGAGLGSSFASGLGMLGGGGNRTYDFSMLSPSTPLYTAPVVSGGGGGIPGSSGPTMGPR